MLKVKGFFFPFRRKTNRIFRTSYKPFVYIILKQRASCNFVMLLVNKEVLFGSTALYFVKFQMLQIKISGIINTDSVRDAQREKRRSVVRPRRHVLGSSL